MGWTIQGEGELRAGSKHKNTNPLKILRNLREGTRVSKELTIGILTVVFKWIVWPQHISVLKNLNRFLYGETSQSLRYVMYFMNSIL